MRIEKKKTARGLLHVEDKSIRNISIRKSSTPESSAKSGRPGDATVIFRVRSAAAK